MKKELINLGAKTRGERWFQSAVSNASGLGWSKFLIIFGVLLTLIYFVFFFDPTGGVTFLIIGIGWICAGIIHFERHHARKVIIRLMNANNDGEVLNEADESVDE